MACIRQAKSGEEKPVSSPFAETSMISSALLIASYLAAKQDDQQCHHGREAGRTFVRHGLIPKRRNADYCSPYPAGLTTIGDASNPAQIDLDQACDLFPGIKLMPIQVRHIEGCHDMCQQNFGDLLVTLLLLLANPITPLRAEDQAAPGGNLGAAAATPDVRLPGAASR
jgi:hypothetical protein